MGIRAGPVAPENWTSAARKMPKLGAGSNRGAPATAISPQGWSGGLEVLESLVFYLEGFTGLIVHADTLLGGKEGAERGKSRPAGL